MKEEVVPFVIVDGKRLSITELENFINESEYQTKWLQNEIELGKIDAQTHGLIITTNLKFIKQLKKELAKMKACQKWWRGKEE